MCIVIVRIHTYQWDVFALRWSFQIANVIIVFVSKLFGDCQSRDHVGQLTLETHAVCFVTKVIKLFVSTSFIHNVIRVCQSRDRAGEPTLETCASFRRAFLCGIRIDVIGGTLAELWAIWLDVAPAWRSEMDRGPPRAGGWALRPARGNKAGEPAETPKRHGLVTDPPLAGGRAQCPARGNKAGESEIVSCIL